MSMEVFVVEYVQWLLDQAFRTKAEQRTYCGVTNLLLDIPFYWSIELDGDRAGDAAAYRVYHRHVMEQANRTRAINTQWLDLWEQATPSVFEVMLGISERWSFFYEKPMSYYFMHLFRNMGYHQFRGSYLEPWEMETIRRLTDNWLSRQIEPNGDGSPFPIAREYLNVDMRTENIWQQMNAYSRQHFW